MIVDAHYRNHHSHAVEREISSQLYGDPAGDFLDHEYDESAAEICRMIELSGMVGLECDILLDD
jgi:hypothetical protein